MSGKLQGKRVAILATDGFEQSELLYPREVLLDAGAIVEIVSPKRGRIRAWDDSDWGEEIEVDVQLSEADADDYDALMLPGGVMNPDKLRINPEAVQFVRDFVEEGKPIGAICHASWTLIEAEAVQGRRMTSWPSLSADLRNAGADWVDEEVVVDRGLVTSRKPADLPAFNRELIEEIAEGIHDRGARMQGTLHEARYSARN